MHASCIGRQNSLFYKSEIIKNDFYVLFAVLMFNRMEGETKFNLEFEYEIDNFTILFNFCQTQDIFDFP